MCEAPPSWDAGDPGQAPGVPVTRNHCQMVRSPENVSDFTKIIPVAPNLQPHGVIFSEFWEWPEIEFLSGKSPAGFCWGPSALPVRSKSR